MAESSSSQYWPAPLLRADGEANDLTFLGAPIVSLTEFNSPHPSSRPEVETREVAVESLPGSTSDVDKTGQVGTRRSILGRLWSCSERPTPARAEERQQQTAIGRFKECFSWCLPTRTASSATHETGIGRTPSAAELKSTNEEIEHPGTEGGFKQASPAAVGEKPAITTSSATREAGIGEAPSAVEPKSANEEIEQPHAGDSKQVSPEPDGEKPAESSFKLVTPGVPIETQNSVAARHKVTGLCCSFAMDWAKKCLESKSFSKDTCTAENLEEVAKRQRKYYDSAEKLAKSLGADKVATVDNPLQSAAMSYKLTIEESPSWQSMPDKFGDWENRGKLEQGVYYIEVLRKNGGTPHGFAIDNRYNDKIGLTDVGSGTYRCFGMSAEKVVEEHVALLNKGIAKGAKEKDPDTRINAVFAMKLGLQVD